MTEPLLTTVVHHGGHWVVVEARGEVDADTAPLLRRACIDALAEHRHIVIDLSGVTFLDSAGLSVLVGTMRRATTDGGAMRVVATSPAVLRVLRITALDEVFDLRATVADAVGAVDDA